MATATDTNESLISLLQQHVSIVKLHIGWAKMTNKIDNVDVSVTIDEQTVKVDKDKTTAPQWKLLPGDWRKRFSAIERAARRALKLVSVDMVDMDMHIVPSNHTDALFAQLTELRRQLNDTADEFVAAYPGIKAALRQEHGEKLFEQMNRKLPTTEEIQSAFKMRWVIVTLGETSFDLITEQTMISEARNEMKNLIAESVEAMARKPREELVKAIDHVLTAVQNHQRIQQGSLDAIQRAFNRLRDFSFVANDEIMETIANAEQTLTGTTSHDVNTNEAIGQRLSEILRATRDVATSDLNVNDGIRKFRAAGLATVN